MKRIGNLYEQICSMDNLKLAHEHARKGKGWYEEVKMVNGDPETYLTELREMLLNHTYHTSPYTIFSKFEKNKVRTIYKLPYFPDRICQWAVLQVIEPYLMRRLNKNTYSALPKRGIHMAMRDVQKAMRTDVPNCQYCLKFDVNHYYPSIDHEIMKKLFRKIFKDPDLLWLLDEILDSISTGTEEGVGIPIGNYLSQWCGNLYLSWFDHWIKEEMHVKYYFRYMDDVVIFGSDKSELHELQIKISAYLQDNLHLQMKHTWQVFPTYVRGVDFVGYRIFLHYTLLRKSTYKALRKRMNTIRKKTDAGKLMNRSEWCSINSYKGWLDHCNGFRLRKKYLDPLNEAANRYYLEVIKSKDQRKAA